MKAKKKSIVATIVVAILLITSVAGAYVWYKKPSTAAQGPTVQVKKGSLTETAAASGKIEPAVQVEVKSRGSGEVVEILVKEGDQVKAGQLLVQLDPIRAQRALDQAVVSRDKVKADLAAASASLTVADLDQKNSKTTEEIAQKTADMGLGSTDAVRTAGHAAKTAAANLNLKRAQLAGTQASLKTAELAVADAETVLKETKIFAPVDGTVLDIAVEKGTIVSSALTNVSGGTVVMTIADLSSLRIVGSIDEAQIGRVAVGQRAEIRVDAYADKVFQGKVDFISPLGKEVSSVVTFEVQIVVADEQISLLRSGMSADVEIVTAEQKDVLLVPLLAVQSKERRRFVRLPNGEERPIKTGATDGTKMVVLEGLSEGDTVLASAPAAPAASSGNNQQQRAAGGQGAMRGMGMGR